MAKKRNKSQNARFYLAEEWRWWRNHPQTLEGYIERYGDADDSNRYGSGARLFTRLT